MSARLGALRRSSQSLEREVAALESSVALRPDDRATRAALEAKRAELETACDELEALEADLENERQAVDELEQLVDSFSATITRVPELAPVLEAMKLTVGALATTKRLQRADVTRTEPGEVAAALGQALTILATWISTPSGRVRLPDALSGTPKPDGSERFENVVVQHRGRAGVATLEARFEASNALK